MINNKKVKLFTPISFTFSYCYYSTSTQVILCAAEKCMYLKEGIYTEGQKILQKSLKSNAFESEDFTDGISIKLNCRAGRNEKWKPSLNLKTHHRILKKE